MWRFKLRALYWVRMKMRRRFELMQFERVMSMMRERAPKGTAGLARSRVSGQRRSPWPPARSTTMASRISDIYLPPAARMEKRLILTTEGGKKTSADVSSRGGIPVGEEGSGRSSPVQIRRLRLTFILASIEYPGGYEVGSVPW